VAEPGTFTLGRKRQQRGAGGERVLWQAPGPGELFCRYLETKLGETRAWIRRLRSATCALAPMANIDHPPARTMLNLLHVLPCNSPMKQSCGLNAIVALTTTTI